MTEHIGRRYGLLPDGPDEMGRELADGPDVVASALTNAGPVVECVAAERTSSDRLVLMGTGASLAMAITAAPWFRASDTWGRGRTIGTREACVAALGALDAEAFRSSDLVVAISVSGDSPETVAAARLARAQNARILVVTAHPRSPLADAGDLVLHTPVRPERGASTASALAALAALGALAGVLATDPDGSSATKSMLAALVAAPDAAAEAGGLLAQAGRVWIAGFGSAEGLARAGALLLHEKAGIAAVATTPSEFRHGLIEATSPRDAFVLIDSGPPDSLRIAYGHRLSRELADARIVQIVVGTSPDTAPPTPGLLVSAPGGSPALAALAALLRIQQLGRVAAHARGTYRDGFRYLRSVVLAADELLRSSIPTGR